MFVVRATGPAKQDWKAFQARADALDRFVRMRQAIIEDDQEGVHAVVFHVPGEADARRAVERIKAGDSDVIIIDKSWIDLSAEDEAAIMEMIKGDTPGD